MATLKNNAEVLQKPLEVTAEQYYFNTFQPFLQTVMSTCTTDAELGRTVEKVMNACNTLCNQKKYQEMTEELVVLNRAINDKSYFYGVMKRATEEEKSLVRELIDKINTLNMIIKCEPEVQPTVPKTKDRIGYKTYENPDLNENEDFVTHNMHSLNKPMPKTRIPNT